MQLIIITFQKSSLDLIKTRNPAICPYYAIIITYYISLRFVYITILSSIHNYYNNLTDYKTSQERIAIETHYDTYYSYEPYILNTKYVTWNYDISLNVSCQLLYWLCHFQTRALAAWNIVTQTLNTVRDCQMLFATQWQVHGIASLPIYFLV